jgi:surface polysaccharide O-acyltransferase-like enzyme
MISGSLFLNKKQLNIKHLWQRNISHLFVVYLIWSFLYAIDILGIPTLSIDSIPLFITQFIYSSGHLWFLPALISLYIIFPFLYTLVHYKNGILVPYFLGLFFIIGIIKPTLLIIPGLPLDFINVLNKINVEGFSYSGYFILGYWLSRKNTKKIPAVFPLLVFIGSVVGASFLGYQNAISNEVASGLLFSNFCLPVFVEAIALFILFQNLLSNREVPKIIQTISSYTFGIYLLHVFVYQHLDFRYGLSAITFNPIFSILLVSTLTFIICLIFVAILKKIPFIKNWIV